MGFILEEGPACNMHFTYTPSLLLSSLELGDTTIYEPEIRALLGTILEADR